MGWALSLSGGASPFHVPELAILPIALGGNAVPLPPWTCPPRQLALQVNQECLQGSPGPDQCGAAGAALPAAHLRAGEGAALLPPHHGPGVPPAAGGSAVPSRYPWHCCTPPELGSAWATAPAPWRQRFTLCSPCRLGSSCGTGPWHGATLPAARVSACALGQWQAGLHLGECVSGPGPLYGKACPLGICGHCPCPGAFVVCLHVAPADAGLWLQAQGASLQPTGAGTVCNSSPLFIRWSCLPRGTWSSIS